MPDQHLPIYAKPSQEASPQGETTSRRPVTTKHFHSLHGKGFRPLSVTPPNGKIAPGSAKAGVTAGKTPGRYDLGLGAWTGIAKWPTLTALTTLFTGWCQYPPGQPPGIGLRCDRLFAVDIDVEDREIADALEAEVLWLAPDAPVRFRDNSPRRLALCRMDYDDPLPKSLSITMVHPTKGKAGLDILTGAGKFFVAYGPHTSGAPYRWRNGSPASIRHLDDLPAFGRFLTDILTYEFIRCHEAAGYTLKSRPAGGVTPHSPPSSTPFAVGSLDLLAPSPWAVRRLLTTLRNDGAFETYTEAHTLIRAAKAAAGGSTLILPSLIGWAKRWDSAHRTTPEKWVRHEWNKIKNSTVGWEYLQRVHREQGMTDDDFDSLLSR